ncbi:MAG: efflux RND transporter periplasmic adaptor subunit [Spirochaetales bacterium]|nr:efflux RND transporter periplasmic adaptor subunit [Spirochaetales bacterium]
MSRHGRGRTRAGSALAALRAAAVAAACGGVLAAPAACARREPVEEAVYREPVHVARAEVRQVRPLLDTFGTIVYLNKADVFPTTEGVVEALEAEEGMHVRKGQVLAVLSPDRLRVAREGIAAEVESREALLALAEEKLREGRMAVEARLLGIAKAEAELAQRRAEFENLSLVYANKKKLHRAGGVAEGELESVRTRHVAAQMQVAQAESELEIQMIGFRDQDLAAAGLDVPGTAEERREALVELNTRMLAAERAVAAAELNASRAELRRVEMSLEETTVRAPIDGIVGARLLDLGASASPETLLFTLFNTDTVFAQVEISEAELSRVTVGQEAAVCPDPGGEQAIPERAFPGTVELISPYVNPQSRTARVRVRLANPSGRLVPGMFVRVRIFLGDPAEQVVVPASAVLVDPEENSLVFLVRGGRVFRRPIVPGHRDEDWLVVSRGLQPGDTVVLDPSPTFREGAQIEVRP